MDGLDLLGADALANQYITLRVTNIDRETLKRKLGDSAAAGLYFVDAAPKAALDAALPFAIRKAKEYGVDVEASVANAPLAKARSSSEFWPGLALGVGVGGAGLVIVKLVAHLVGR